MLMKSVTLDIGLDGGVGLGLDHRHFLRLLVQLGLGHVTPHFQADLALNVNLQLLDIVGVNNFEQHFFLVVLQFPERTFLRFFYIR